VFLIPPKTQIDRNLLNQAENYKEALEMSQAKINHTLDEAVGRPALLATRKRPSMNDFIGMILAYRLWPNRKMT